MPSPHCTNSQVRFSLNGFIGLIGFGVQNMKDTEAPGEAELQTVGLAVTGGDVNCGDKSRYA